MSAAFFCKKTGVRLVAEGVSKAVDPEHGQDTFDGTEPPPYAPENAMGAAAPDAHAPGARVVTGNVDSTRAREREAAAAPRGDLERERADGRVIRVDRTLEAGQVPGAPPPRSPEDKAADDAIAQGPGPKTLPGASKPLPGEDDPHAAANRDRKAAGKGVDLTKPESARAEAPAAHGATDTKDASMAHVLPREGVNADGEPAGGHVSRAPDQGKKK